MKKRLWNKTLAAVEKIDGEGWTLEDNRSEVPGYKEKKKEQQVDSINRILDVMKIALETGELDEVGSTMTENHKILIDMGLSHEKLIYLCNLAIEKGALGAKVTGGGRGGYMVALTPGDDLQETVAAAMVW